MDYAVARRAGLPIGGGADVLHGEEGNLLPVFRVNPRGVDLSDQRML